MVRRSATAEPTAMRPLPPVSSKAKDYTERPDEVVDELDELRTRGIAKVLNKHFTITTRKLALEKAEADSALADLERRRAQTKAFVPSNGGELNPYDQLYVQLQRKRAECRRKEKETMMLYQRYVMKYGKSAKAAPLEPTSEQEVANGENTTSGVEQNGDPPGKSALGTLDENSEATFTKFYEKQQEEAEKLKRENEQKSTQNFMSALNHFMSEDDKNQHDDSMELASSKKSASSHGSVDPFMSAVSKFTTKATRDEGNFETSILKKQVEAIQTEPDAATQTSVEANLDNGIVSVVTPERTPVKTLVNDPPVVDMSTDTSVVEVYEDESMVSEHQPEPIQQLDPTPKKRSYDPTPRKNFEAILPIDTKEEEPQTVPVSPDGVMPEAATLTLSPSTNLSTPKSARNLRSAASEESPYFQTATVEGFEFDDGSIISELTSKSAVTQKMMDEIETEMEDFIKFEMEAIRKMLDSEEDASTVTNSVKSETSSLMAGDQSVHVAIKAEAMALEMQKILDEFANEEASKEESPAKSLLNQSVSEHASDTVEPTSVYPYKFEPAIPGEEWYVHFDDNYQKEYYVEKNSNRTQWEYPQKTPTPRVEEVITSDDFISDMHSVASSRRSTSRRSTRRALYRKKRKRRRARRLMVSFVALFCVLVSVFYWRIKHPDESVARALVAFFVGLKTLGAKGVVRVIVDEFEYSFTDRREREDLIRQQQDTLAKIEKERKDRELAEKRAKEEAKRRMRAAKEKEAREAKERAAREEAARKRAEEQQEFAKKQQLSAKHRHMACNIPFAYVVPHCWRLAKTNPIFGLKDETDLIFLQ